MGLLAKLYAGYVAVIFLTLSLIFLLVSRRVEEDAVAEVERALAAKAVLLRAIAAPSLAAGDAAAAEKPGLSARIRGLGAEIGTRLTVIAADGKVVADSDEDPAHMDDHALRPEIEAARAHGRGVATRASRTLAKRMMYVALRVERDGVAIGYARAALPLDAVDRHLAHLRAVVGLGAGIAAAVALVVGYLLARRLTGPLRSMTAAAAAIAGGDYAQRVRTTSRDEVGRLAEAWNHMAVELGARVEELARERAQVLAILGGMVEGVVAVDRDERVVHMNAVAGRILRAAPDESLGRPIWEVTRVREVSELLGRTMQAGAAASGDVRLQARPRDHVVEMHASPLRNGTGGVAGAVLVLHDVTELRRLESVRREFVANVSHELKTPLTAIRGLVETLIDDAAIDPGRARRFLEKVRDQTNRLATLVADLLTLSRVESEEGAIDRKPLDLRHPVLESARALLPSAEEKGLRVETDVPDAAVAVLGDEEALRQVVDNLLSNAIQYTPKGGRVRVRVRADRSTSSAAIEVEDTGIGIEPRDQDRIFERFYRVDRARSRELGGTGLGLAIVKHVALSLGGQVAVESTPGKGSTFRVELPLAPPAPPATGK